MTHAADSVQVHLSDAIATVTLDRPEQLNAIDGPMLEELISRLEALAANDACRAVVLAGSGKAFCAGAKPNAIGPR